MKEIFSLNTWNVVSYMYVALTCQLLNDNSIWKVSFHMPILVERPYAIETLKDQLSLWDGYTLL